MVSCHSVSCVSVGSGWPSSARAEQVTRLESVSVCTKSVRPVPSRRCTTTPPPELNVLTVPNTSRMTLPNRRPEMTVVTTAMAAAIPYQPVDGVTRCWATSAGVHGAEYGEAMLASLGHIDVQLHCF